MKRNIALGVIFVALLALFSGMYVVDEREQVAVTRFGALVATVDIPGLHWKIPFVTDAKPFPKVILDWDGQRGKIPTGDKTYVWVDTFGRWKIVDLYKFYTTVGNIDTAMSRLDSIIESATRDIIQKASLLDLVRTTNTKLAESGDFSDITDGRAGIVAKIYTIASEGTEKFGIKLVGFDLKRLNYIEQTRTKVYNRMSAERNQEAARINSEGGAEVADIDGQREKELKRIYSAAQRTAKEIKGEAEATAAKIYADAYDIDPKFYDFYQKMKMYRIAASKGTELFVSTNSPLWNLVEGLPLK